MKSRNPNKPAIAMIGVLFSNMVAAANALRYGYAAERDERKGFPYTAAMEWRKAAESFAPNTRTAEYFWRQWERIMHLPRRLAGPIGGFQNPCLPLQVASASRFGIVPAIDQISSAHAA